MRSAAISARSLPRPARRATTTDRGRGLPAPVAHLGHLNPLTAIPAAQMAADAGRDIPITLSGDGTRLDATFVPAFNGPYALRLTDEPGLTGIYGTIFTGPPTVPGADSRNVTIFAEGEVDRSPCGTGTCAVLAVLDAMGLVDDTKPFVHESLIGSTFSARVTGRGEIGAFPAIIPELSGDAWITGEHRFIVQKNDPLRRGFRI